MKRNMIKLAAGAAALLMMATSAEAGYAMKKKVGNVDTKLIFYGFAQLDAIGGEGMQIKKAKSVEKASSNIGFRAQRIRLGWKYIAGNLRGKVFLDFNQAATGNGADANGAAIPKLVKDAFISYVVDPALVIKAGLIKMPNGMGFTMPGWNLDIAERGMDKQLVLERNTGLMLSGRDMFLGNNGKVNGFEMGHERPWKGFGYDIMIANQANRGKASKKSSAFGGNSYAVRGMFDYTEKLHIEASYGLSENADGKDGLNTNGVDYSNINVGVDSNLGALSLKGEYFNASNINGIEDYDESVFTGTAAYFVTPTLEVVGKHIQASATKGANADATNLGNTYLGLNIFLSTPYQDFSRKSKRMRNQHKVVLNYIVASGAGATETGADKWSGLSGYRANAFIAQYQFKF
ncbi:porin [Sulfurimonas sp. SAG-AH-194-C21]|nr:hypothetical protein [Sulfurimonas sp. SAG-AH-194-C21]MDF1883471.1 porin [Sulfurimonas sp. SAG-AH-194-C21]